MALSTSRTVLTQTGINTFLNYDIGGLNSAGIATFSNFKTGSTNVHSVGVEAAGINVLGGDTPIGSGSTVYDDGSARFTGVVTATEFHGSGANLTGIDATAIQTGNTKIQTSATLISNQISGSGIATVQAGGLDVTGVVTATSFVGSGVNLTGVSGPEVYGFTGIGSNLQVRTTNGGADNITSAQYDAFEQVLFAPSGMTFSINNNGNLIATF